MLKNRRYAQSGTLEGAGVAKNHGYRTLVRETVKGLIIQAFVQRKDPKYDKSNKTDVTTNEEYIILVGHQGPPTWRNSRTYGKTVGLGPQDRR